jgi:hypothetical protein
MRRFFSVCAAALLAGAGAASANTVNIALLSAMGSDSEDTAIINTLKANAAFLNITVFKVDQMTPSVGVLEGFQAALVAEDTGFFKDPVALGDALKSYIDDGFGLVVTAASNTSGMCSSGVASPQICGGFQTSDYYWAIEPGAITTSPFAAMGTVAVPDSPILNGVRAGTAGFDGGTFAVRINGSLGPGATKVASWSDPSSTPLIATRTFASGATEVGLNFFPISPYSYTSASDGGLILTNAVLLAANYTGADEALPEPETYLVAGSGLGLLALLWRRRRAS